MSSAVTIVSIMMNMRASLSVLAPSFIGRTCRASLAPSVVLFAVTIWLGLAHHSDHWQHQACGVVKGLYTCLTHSVVLMHFMGSGKAIKEAVQTHALPDDPKTGYTRQTRRS